MLRRIVLTARNNHVVLRLSSASVLNEASSSSPSPSSSPPDTVYLSENFIRKMKELQSREPPEKKLLRLGVESGGCSGLKYVFDLDCRTASDDGVFEKDEIKLVVDSVSYEFVRGATVDYVDTLIRSAFVVVENPRAEKPCSCHDSFAAKQ